ncbi:UNVERIFIED_CONTAM: hypothetical protein GTU68_053957 [Idotea baltica]|nr:hypothetical protein [Idotea baltica]
MVKRKGLGRGLDALLSAGEEDSEEEGVKLSSQDTLKQIPIEFMTRGKYQPRRDMHPGVMQPIVVRPVGVDSYEIIAGERRWRATQLAGLETIPAIIRDVPDESAIAMALIENIQREDLNAIEEAQALIRLQQEFELTQQQVAEAVGKSRTTITNLMRLMSLEQEVQTLLEHGDLEMGHARALLGLEGRAQLDTARTAVAKGMTVRQTEALVRHLQQQQEQPEQTENQRMDPDIKRLQDKLSDQVGAAVSIQHNAKGKGRLILKYNSLDELEGILDHIK